jgi:hypothetical protein
MTGDAIKPEDLVAYLRRSIEMLERDVKRMQTADYPIGVAVVPQSDHIAPHYVAVMRSGRVWWKFVDDHDSEDCEQPAVWRSEPSLPGTIAGPEVAL